MTLRANGRLAGVAFLVYIVAGISQMVVFGQATGGGETAAQLANVAQHAAAVRLTVLLELVEAVCALVLAVTIYALTREADRDLAMLAMMFRVAEGVINANSSVRTLELLKLATAGASAGPGADTVGGLLLAVGPGGASAFCFAVGSTIYSWLFLSARSIPVPLAWLGVFASVLVVALQPAQYAGFLRGPVTGFMWIPMLLFEVTLALWLIFKGVGSPARLEPARGAAAGR